MQTQVQNMAVRTARPRALLDTVLDASSLDAVYKPPRATGMWVDAR